MSFNSLIFVRHAQSIGNIMTQDERSTCPIPNHAYPLTNIGKQQAILAGKYLKTKLRQNLPDIFVCSTFLRTQQTMEIILEELGVSDLAIPVVDSRLDEKWDGIFHELSKAEIEKMYPEQIRLKNRSGYYHYRAPGGESCPDVEIRVKNFMDDSNLEEKKILAVGSGRWFIIAQRLIHNLTVDQFLQLKEKDDCPNCSITEYDRATPLNFLPVSITPWRGILLEQETEFA